MRFKAQLAGVTAASRTTEQEDPILCVETIVSIMRTDGIRYLAISDEIILFDIEHALLKAHMESLQSPHI